ncbi:MAG: dephospho-CoA kinase [Lachnospiraceae bacterium]|nr:dephospho-CoA kinase [Lachnospiraceae bacterium]
MVLGVCGGVGSGKSFVIEYLEKQGAFVILSDEVAKKISEEEGPALEKIRELFKDDNVLTSDGRMDRAKVAALIFNDEKKKNALNDILHPATKEEIIRMISDVKEKEPDRLVLLESAIFFETGCDKLVDKVLFVYADEDVRIKRLMDGRGYTEEKCRAIMAKQMSSEELKERCDYVVNNSGTLEETIRQCEEFLQ